MSSYFARSINKAPAYLAPRHRPTIGRTLSNSSDLSLASNCSGRSEDVGDTVTSAPGTPTLETVDQRHHTNKQRSDSPALLSPRAGTTRPIAIEIPKIRKSSSSACNTPDDEPVSARGDLPGGYFPLHEEKARVHRHHPFQQQLDSRNPAKKDNATMRSSYQGSSHVPTSSVHAGPTVCSYLPAGFPDHPLPVGKYYPSNYEQRNSHLKQQHNYVSDSMMSFSRSHDPSTSRFSPGPDSRQRLEQYQRDMAAQAAMALDGTTRGGSKHNIKGLALPDARYMSSTPPKPLAPRLIPLGSPGPVTPMELETKDGEFLNKGNGPSMLSKENMTPPGAGYTAHSL